MKTASSLSTAIFLAALAACGGRADVAPPPEGASGFQAPTPPPGFHISEGPTVYDSESLFQYLDGGAPLYLKYGFQSLTQTRYQLGDDPFASVTLDVYDMGSELGAFGIYRSIAAPGAAIEDWGAEGSRSGTVAAAWKGSFYVQGEADDGRPELVGGLEHLMALAVGAIRGSVALPSDLDVLPREGLRAGSERYVAADLFGQAFLPGGVTAAYEVDGGQVELFYSRLGGVAEAVQALERLRAHEQQWGEVEADVDQLGDGGFRFTDPGLGSGVFIRNGSSIAGFHGDGDGDDLVRELLTRLPQS
jgi:hypothetical protein